MMFQKVMSMPAYDQGLKYIFDDIISRFHAFMCVDLLITIQTEVFQKIQIIFSDRSPITKEQKLNLMISYLSFQKLLIMRLIFGFIIFILMGCQNSQEANNPLPTSIKETKIATVAPIVQPYRTQNHFMEGDEFVNFESQSVTPRSPKESIKKEPSQREKTYIQQKKKKIKKKIKIEQAAIESQSQSQSQAIINNGQQLLNTLTKLISRQEIYNWIVQADYLCKILQQIKLNHIQNDSLESILLTLIEYTQYSTSQNLSNKDLDQYVSQLAQQLFKIKHLINKNTANKLKGIKYLKQNEEQNKISFLNLKFDLSQQDFLKVLVNVKELLKYDEKSVNFILIYFHIATTRLQKALTPVIKIQQKLINCITILSESTIEVEASPNCSIPSFPKVPYPKKMVDFTNINKESRVQFTEQLIKNCANQAQKAVFPLRELLWKSSRLGKSAQILLYNKSDRALLETKRSLADVHMQKVNLQTATKEIDELTLEDLYILQQMTYKEQLKDILAFIDAPFQFKSHSLLQARLYFQHTAHIQQFTEALRSQMQKKKYIIVKAANKMANNNSVSQIVLWISLNSVSAEVHLILDINYNMQYYNTFTKSIIDNHNFTYCSHLRMMAMHYLPSYLSEMKQIILINSGQQTKGKNMDQKLQHFYELQSLLSFTIPENQQIDHLLLEEGIRLLNSKKQQIIPKSRGEKSLAIMSRMLNFKIIMKDPSVDQMLNEFYESFEQKDLPNIELRLQKRQKLSQLDIELLKRYAEHIKQVGINFLNKDFPDKAQAKFQIFIRISNFIDNQIMKAEGKRCLALIQQKKGNFNKSLQILEKCMEVVQKLENPILQIPFQESIAKIYTEQQKFDSALKIYERIQQILNQINEEVIKIAEKIGQLHYRTGHQDKALKKFKQCLRDQELKTGLESYECAYFLMKISETLFKLKDTQSSITSAQKSLKIIQKFQTYSDAIERQISVRKHLATLFINNGKYDLAVDNLLENLKLLEKNSGKFSNQYGDTLQQLGLTYQLTQKYQQSLVNYQQSLMIKERIDSKNESSQLQLISRIAKVHEKLNNTGKCMKYQAKISRIEAKEREIHSKDHINTFISIAKKSLEKGNYPLSLKYFQKSLDILEEQKGKDSTQSIPLLKSMGMAYKLQGHLEQAIKYFSQSLTLLQRYKGKNNIQAAQSYYQIGNIYDTKNSFELAQTYYSAALLLCEKFNVKYTVFANTNFGLANLYFRQQIYSKAFQCYERSLPLLQKLYPKLYVQAVQNMEICDRQIEQQFPHTEEEDTEIK